MPFKSQAQRRKFYALKREGKMDQATIDEWEKDTPKKLPERVEKKAFWHGFEKRSEEVLKGGLADNTPDSDYPADQLAMGIKVEREHTSDPRKAKEVAKDHLKEDPKYYTKLKKMEEG